MEEDWDDDWDDDWEDPEPDEEETDESETVPCPACGVLVYEDSPRCPACGSYVTHATSVLSGKPAWFVVLALLGVAAVILAMVWSF